MASKKSKQPPKTSLEDFLVDLYVKIDGKVWEQEAQFNLIKKSLLDNVLHRPGKMSPETRMSLGKAMSKCDDEKALRAAVARYIDVGSACRELRFHHENGELVATKLAGSEAFRAPCPPAGRPGWKVGELEKFLVAEKLIAGTYVFFVQDLRADAQTGIEDISSVMIKEVVSECPRARTESDEDQGHKFANYRDKERGGIFVGSLAVLYKGEIDESTKTGLPPPPEGEKAMDVTKMDPYDTVCMLRDCVRSLDGYEKVLRTLEEVTYAESLSQFVRQDQGANEGASPLAHVFSIEPAVVQSKDAEIVAISSRLAALARERLESRLAEVPSTQNLWNQTDGGGKTDLLDTISKKVETGIRVSLKRGRRDRSMMLKWHLVSNSRIRVPVELYQNDELFILCEGYLQVMDGLKGKVRPVLKYEVPQHCLQNKALADADDADGGKSEDDRDLVKIDHDAEMNFRLHLNVKVLTVNLVAIEDNNNEELELPAKDLMSMLKKMGAVSRPVTRLP